MIQLVYHSFYLGEYDCTILGTNGIPIAMNTKPDSSTPPPIVEHSTIREEVYGIAHGARGIVKNNLSSFVVFIREQGVIGLAIGFLLGGAVSKTVSSFVDNVVNPIIGLALGKVTLSDRVFIAGDATIKYGTFITALVNLVMVGIVLFLMVKAYQSMEARKKTGENAPEAITEDIVLLREIRDALQSRS